jgi:hypothetical protein
MNRATFLPLLVRGERLVFLLTLAVSLKRRGLCGLGDAERRQQCETR